MSKYLAYTFLYDNTSDLKCDFEILSDEVSSMIGLLRSLLDDVDKAADPSLEEDLCRINELMYHINPSLRTKTAVTEEELQWLYQKTRHLQEMAESGGTLRVSSTFVLPQGCTQAAYSHVIRSKCKSLVRLLSRYQQQGNPVDALLLDFVNLFSGYFYLLALWFNKNRGEAEQPFTSRVY